MSYLSREAAPLPDTLWSQIDGAVVKAASNILTGRRFLHIYGPLGISTESIEVDDAEKLQEEASEGFITTTGRRYMQIPMLYEDFTLLAKDLEKSGHAPDLSKAMSAAEKCALREDKFIFFGNEALGYEGILTASGANRMPMKDWGVGENAFTDIAEAINLMVEAEIYGPYTLVMSPDLYLKLQRLQPNTGLLEIDRVNKLLSGGVYKSPVLGKEKAALICADQRNMDLVIGQDMATAYLEQSELNHRFRVIETILPRIKRSKAVVIFE